MDNSNNIKEKERIREGIITYYKNNPCLWNNKLKKYSNKYKRVQLTEQLSKELHCTGKYNIYNITIIDYMCNKFIY